MAPLRRSVTLGTKNLKLDAMLRISLRNEPLIALQPNAPFWLFKPQAQHGRSDYENGWGLPLIFSPNGDPAPGIVTTHDEFAISWDAREAAEKVKALLASADESEARKRFQLCTQNQWNYTQAKEALSSGTWKNKIVPVLYRPFDVRTTIYDSHVAVHRRDRVSLQVIDGKNLSIITCRQQSQYETEWNLVGVTRGLIESCTISNKTKEINYLFPLWRYQGATQSANLSPSFTDSIQSTLNLIPTDYRPEDPNAPLHAEKIFHYLYAVLHSPAYRQRYAAFLRTDFPRIPIPGSRQVFDALAALGSELVAWHLLEHPEALAVATGSPRPTSAVSWFGQDMALNKVAEKSRALADLQGGINGVGKVYVNATSGFANVQLGVWQHTIGGYQVLHKWLDDRRKAGRSLSTDDITHWLRVYAALKATQKLMTQVDAAIERHGGWPGAFSQNHPPPDAATLALEQQAQKEQLKAQKKSIKASKKSAAPTSPTGATSLFDFGDEG